MNKPPVPARPELVAALGRLQASRLMLRHEMIPQPSLPPEEADGGQRGFTWPRRMRAVWRRMRQRTGGWPVAGVAMTALGEWWHHHPWRPAGEMVMEELRGSVFPVVRRNPMVFTAVAAGLGVALAVSRPWNWPGVAQQVRPLPQRVGRWALRQLASPPVQAALISLLVVLKKSPAPPAGPVNSEPADGPSGPTMAQGAGPSDPAFASVAPGAMKAGAAANPHVVMTGAAASTVAPTNVPH